MIKLGLLVSLVFLLGTVATAYAQTTADAIVGKWLDGKGKAHIEIYKTEGGKYFGKIVWLTEPVYPANDEKGMAGKPKVDRENPDASKRSQPIVGLVILRDFKHSNGNVWEDGKIYDPDNGKDYSCKMTLKDNEHLEVRGFIGFSFLGRTEHWTRVKASTD